MGFKHMDACPKCREVGMDNTGDNLAVYDDGVYCYACGYSKGNGKKNSRKEETETVSSKPKKIITQEENNALKARTTSDVTYRGVRPETNRFFGVRYELDDSGEIVAQYVPSTIDTKLSGYSKRIHPKQFLTAYGSTGKECDLVGQFRFKASSHTVLIVGGQVDQLSAYQMLRDDQIARGKEEFEPMAVVSPTVGEGGSASQLAAQYKFFSQFKKIIIGYDNDAAGKEATEKLIKVLPKGRIHIANWRYNDPNEYIWDNVNGIQVDRTKAFINDFWNAKKYVPASIVGSNSLYEKVLEGARVPKIPLPPFMSKLQRMMSGGIPLGYVVNIGAASGGGKTSLVNEMINYWIFNSPYKIGVVSMELEAGQYGEAMLSRYVQRKIALIEDMDDKIDYLESDHVKQAAYHLFNDENGDSRFHLLDDRDGGVEAIKEVTEELITTCDCQVIVLDPLQDILDGMNNEDQAIFMRWQKGMIKSHGVTFININHVRKSGSGEKANSQGAFITEEDFAGSSTIFKSAGANILAMRDKYAEDDIERNTTRIDLSKCRWTGLTGHAGEYYYDNATHTMHDKEVWMKENNIGEF